MASEQKLDVIDKEPIGPSHATEQTVNPPSGCELPNCCPSDIEHKGEPVTHPVTATLENGSSTEGQRTGGEGQGAGTGDLEISGEVEQDGADSEWQGVLEKNRAGEEREGAAREQEKEVTCEDRPGQETNIEVLSLGETGQQVTDEETGPQVTDEERGPQVKGEETRPLETEETNPQVTAEKTDPQVASKETGEQVTGEETGPLLSGEVTDPQNTADESDPQVTSKETSPVEETGRDAPENVPVHVTDAPENVPVHVTDAGEKWIEMLVRNIVTEVTKEGACTGEGTGEQSEIPGEAADAGVLLTEERTHSIVQGMETNSTTGEQVTEAAGAAVQGTVRETSAPVQVSDESTDITVPLSGEQQGTQVRREGVVEVTDTPEQLNRVETGGDNQGELSCEEADVIDLREAAGAQVCASGEEEKTDTASKVETDRQVTASDEKAERKVTPDMVSDPGREGTADPQSPVACREKEWPPLICTGREVWADTVEQGETEQGTVTEEKLCHRTPEMKDREIMEEGETLGPETPIEREIRLAMEREMILRQERGISVPVGQTEFVEVRRKTITLEPMAQAGKERQLAGAQMQREIQLETRREQDLVDLGKVMGTYDRGPQQELQERKMMFESLNTESSDPPIKKSQNESQQSTFLVVTTSEVPVDSNYVAPVIDGKKGPSYTEANGSNVIIIEHSSLLRRSAPGNFFSSAPADSYSSSTADSHRSAPADSRRSTPADFRRFPPAEASRANSGGSTPPNSADSPIPAPGSPFQLLRSPSPRSLLEREIEEVQERERELRKQRNSVYGRDDSDVETAQKEPESRSDFQSGIYQPERPNWRRLDVNWPPNTGVITNGQQQEQVSDSPYTRRQRSALIRSWEAGTPNPLEDE